MKEKLYSFGRMLIICFGFAVTIYVGYLFLGYRQHFDEFLAAFLTAFIPWSTVEALRVGIKEKSALSVALLIYGATSIIGTVAFLIYIYNASK